MAEQMIHSKLNKPYDVVCGRVQHYLRRSVILRIDDTLSFDVSIPEEGIEAVAAAMAQAGFNGVKCAGNAMLAIWIDTEHQVQAKWLYTPSEHATRTVRSDKLKERYGWGANKRKVGVLAWAKDRFSKSV